jgi:signal transduction histidine kinase
MVRMLEQLYDLSRVRLAGGIPIEPRETNFRILTDKVIDELRLTYPERKLTVVYEGDATTGVWDEERLGQVLTNLVGNALRHGRQDEEVRVTVRGTAEGLSVAVHNGGDVPEDLRPHLFDPFRSGSQKTRDSLGLGLYIVRQIVLAHGGTVDLVSSAEEGTTFRLELPPRAAPTPPPPAAAT